MVQLFLSGARAADVAERRPVPQERDASTASVVIKWYYDQSLMVFQYMPFYKVKSQRMPRTRGHGLLPLAIQMVQRFFSALRSTRRTALLLAMVGLLLAPAWARQPKEKVAELAPPDILLEGGRKLSYERSFSSEREVRIKRGFWTRVLDVVAGEPEYHILIRPFDIAMDSHGRLIVTDPGAMGIHIFDFAQQRYKFVERSDKGKDSLLTPQYVALDAQDNIYVTDSESGKIFVFSPSGKFQRALGSLKGGEGIFKRPTGIAVDSGSQRIYVTDTLRNQVFVLDLKGNVMLTIGQTGKETGQFNFPTALLLHGQDLAVVDAMNFRVQVFDRSGSFQYAVGQISDGAGGMFRPKGIGFDSEGHLYVVDGLWSIVQVFSRDGQLLYYFGQKGTGAGQFQLPTGLVIDHDDRIFVVDSFNGRIQVFRYTATAKQAKGDSQ